MQNLLPGLSFKKKDIFYCAQKVGFFTAKKSVLLNSSALSNEDWYKISQLFKIFNFKVRTDFSNE